MAEPAGANAVSNPFSGLTVVVILCVAGLSFLIMLVLAAWSPELQSKDRAGLHPYSTSSLGYQGLYRLLERRDIPVTISQSPRRLEDDYEALKIVTLTSWGMISTLEETYLAEPMLVVLPKWDGRSDPARPERQLETYLLDVGDVEPVLQTFDADAAVWRLRTPASIRTPFGKFSPDLGDDMQVLRADSLVSVVSVPGGDLIAKLPDREIYILADPDLVNTSGLAVAENARMALSLITWLRQNEWGEPSPVMFDATLHGFERSESLLQMVFDIPFLGATLIALAGFLMTGWAGAVRFGAPLRETRAIALGKQALTDNTAALIAMGRRETRLAPGYLSLMRRATARAVGAPRSLSESELAALFDRLGNEQTGSFTTHEAGLIGPAASRDDLMTKARGLWRWHKEITHGHS